MTAAFQPAFAAALLEPDRPLPPGLARHAGGGAAAFAVYRNNVAVGLIDAMRASFPVVERIVGEEFFAAMARVFVARHPPRSPVLIRYGDAFPAFLAGFPPAADLPYLPDVARLERAHTHAYHAADIAPLGLQALQAVEPERLAGLRLRLHPAFAVIRSDYPIVSIRAMNLDLIPLAPIDRLGPEDALVGRPALDVEVRALPPGAAAFLLALAAGETLGWAAEAALGEAPGFDLPPVLATLFAAGLPTGLVQDEDSVA